MRNSFLISVLMALCSALGAQQSLNNDAIIKLVKAGLSDDLIISTIKVQTGNYNTSANGLIALKAAGVSDKVVAAMVVKAAASAPAPEATDAPQSPSATPVEILAPNEQTAPGPPAAQTSSKDGSSAYEHKHFRGVVRPGARIVIAPMGGFETYFAAAIREKKVPITLTLDRASAQYFIVSTETEWQGFVAGSSAAADWTQSGGHYGSSSAASSTRGLESSIMLIEARSKDVVWAYEVHKSSHGALIFGTLGARGQQSLAEACAKHLLEYMETGK